MNADRTSARRPGLAFSFEFFPPKSDAQAVEFDRAVLRLAGFGPLFSTITYGAGGTTRHRSLAAARRMIGEFGLDTAAHLTCVSAAREEVDATARAFHDAGVRRIVALRGDAPGGAGQPYRPHRGGYAYAADLVAGLRNIAPFEIIVAAYPERHVESTDWPAELDNLKRKQDAGATRAVTQFFFDNDLFERFVERATAAGVTMRIVPGILPVHRFAAVRVFAGRCNASIPKWLADRFEAADEFDHARLAAEIAARQIDDLAARGAPTFHLYTMNRADLAELILTGLGVETPKRRYAA